MHLSVLKKFTAICFFTFLWAIHAKCYGSPAVNLDPNESISITKALLYYEDKTSSLSPNEVANMPSNAFQSIADESGNLGYSSSTFWVKVDVLNLTKQTNWVLRASNALIYFTAYRLDASGKLVKYEPRFNRTYSALIPFKIGQSTSLLIKAKAYDFVDMNFRIQTPELHESTVLDRTVLLGLYTGVTVTLIILNAILLAALRDRIYMYYLLFMAVNTHLNLMTERFPSNIFNFFGWDWWNIAHFYRPFAPLTFFIFTRVLFQTKKHLPKLDKLLILYMAGLIFLSLANLFFDREALFDFEDPYFMIGIGLSFYVAFRSYKRQRSSSTLYAIALTAFTLGIGIYLSAAQNLLPVNDFTMSSMLIGHGCELVIMSIAIAKSVKDLQEDLTFLSYETKLEKLNKLSTVGMMAGGVAHEISNPLAIAMAYLSIALKIGDKNSEPNITLQIKGAIDACLRIQNVVKDIRGLCGGYVPSKDDSANLIESIDNVKSLLRDKIDSSSISIKTCVEKTRHLKIKSNILDMLLRILVDNALDAVGNKENGQVVISERFLPNFFVISVTDNGSGMSNDVRKNILEPFFTTKTSSNGKSIGLGLSIAHRILEAHGWGIEIASMPGKTTFEIRIPNDEVDELLPPKLRNAIDGVSCFSGERFSPPRLRSPSITQQ